jgi:dienelactone hydrolase
MKLFLKAAASFSLTIGLGLALLFSSWTFAADLPVEALTLKASDGVTVFGELHRAERPKALLLVFHQADSNLAEYSTIAPRLVKQGFSVLAIDQRSGGTMFGRSNQTVSRLGKSSDYLDATKDLEAALTWAGSQKLPVAVWGSSYSAALVFLLAASHPNDIKAVLAFSPGEYLGGPDLVRVAAGKVTVPVFVTSAMDDEEIADAKSIIDAVKSTVKTQSIPQVAGEHGSSTLRDDRNPKGSAENWTAVLAFLNANF